MAGATSAGATAFSSSSQDTAPQQRVTPASAQEEQLPEVVESDYTGKTDDDLDVPDFLK